MDIKIPVADEDGNATSALEERISLPEAVEDRDSLDLLKGNTKNRIYELMVNYVLHGLASQPTNDMRKARRYMKKLTVGENFTEQDTESYKFSRIVWKDRLTKLHDKIGNTILYTEDGDNSLLKKERKFRNNEEVEQKKQQFLLHGDNNQPFYLKTKMNLAKHGETGIGELEGLSIKEILSKKDSLVGYYYDRGSYKGVKNEETDEYEFQEGDPSLDEIESKQTELMNTFMIEEPLIHEDILESAIKVKKQGDSMIVEINSYDYWSKVFQRHGFGALKPLVKSKKTVAGKRGKSKWVKDESEAGRKHVAGEREKLRVRETYKVDDPETGFYRVKYIQGKKGATKQDIEEDNPNAKALTLTTITEVKEDKDGEPMLDKEGKEIEIKTIHAGGLLAEQSKYVMPDVSQHDSSFDDLMKLVQYLESIEKPDVFRKKFIENIARIKSKTANMGARDESGYVIERPQYWFEIKEFLVPNDQKLELGILQLVYDFNYHLKKGETVYDLRSARVMENLMVEGTASELTARKQKAGREQSERDRREALMYLNDISTNQTDVNFEKPSSKFYEYLIEEEFVEEDSISEIEERLESLENQEFREQSDEDPTEEQTEDAEQTLDIADSLTGDYSDPSKLQEVMEAGQEGDSKEDENTAILVDENIAKDSYLDAEAFKAHMQEFTDDTPEQYARKIRIIKQRYWNENKHHLEDSDETLSEKQRPHLAPVKISSRIKQLIAVVEATPSGKIQSDLADSRFTMQSTESKGKVSLAQKNQHTILTLARTYNTLGNIIGFIGNRRGA